MTVAGIVGQACSSSLIRGSTASTIEADSVRSYFGGPSLRSAARTVFLLIPITRAIVLIGMPSARCSRRTSAQFSTESTCSLPARLEPGSREGVNFRVLVVSAGHRKIGHSMLTS